jgi:hypothetical protein
MCADYTRLGPVSVATTRGTGYLGTAWYPDWYPTVLKHGGERRISLTRLTFVSGSFLDVKGPHPNLESDFELFCQVIVPALT